MNTKQARYMKVLAEYGTVTAAAKALYVSQPSLSQTLHQMEEELGMPIFDRSVSPFVLTYAGEKYLETANRILQANEELEKEIEELKQEKTGRIRLGVSVSRAIQIIPKLLPSFASEYPDVRIEITECGSAGLEELLLERKIDLALAALEPTGKNIVYELIEQETIGILAGRDTGLSQRFPSGTQISVTEAKNEVFVNLTKEHSARHIQDKLFKRNDMNPKIILETDSLEVGRRVAVEGGVCMILPSAYLDEYVMQHHAEFFPLKDYDNHRNFYACTRKGDFVPAYTRRLITMVGSILEAHPTPSGLEW